jgi:hypothetical protein
MPIELIQGSDTLNIGRIKINQAFSAQTNIWSSGTGSYSIVANNYTNNVSAGNKSLCLGQGNFSYGNYASIFGGYSNGASGLMGVAVGGQQNGSGGKCSFIGNGYYNAISSNYGTICGGSLNTITTYNGSPNFSTIVGGSLNYMTGQVSFIGGGYSNFILKPNFYFTQYIYSAIGCGYLNKTYGIKCVIGGGQFNKIR